MSLSAAARACLPLAAALLSVFLVAATGFDQHTPLPPAIETRFYGFFLDRYPLFAFAIVYGLARLFAAAAQRGSASVVRRILGGGGAMLLLLTVSLHPTFGGLILRSAFATGGMAFLTQQSMPVAHAVGSASAALVFGLALGAGTLIVGGPRESGPGQRRRLLDGGRTMLTRFPALWFALAVLGLAHEAGFGRWPLRPMSGSDSAVASALVLTAFAPDTLLRLRSIGRDDLRTPKAAA